MKLRFLIDVSTMQYSSLVSPASIGMGIPERYGTSVPAAELPSEFYEYMPIIMGRALNNGQGLFHINSRLKPRLFDHTENNSDLVRLRVDLSDYGLSLDDVMRDHPGTIVATMYRKDFKHGGPPSDPWGVVLEAVRFDPTLIEIKKWVEYEAEFSNAKEVPDADF